MTCKIYLEPKALFNKAIIQDTEAKTVYCYFKIMDLLLSDSGLENLSENVEMLDEYYWYNIEPLKSYYHVDFIYDHDKYLGDDSWNIKL